MKKTGVARILSIREGMLSRCGHPESPYFGLRSEAHRDYRDRGITVCTEWRADPRAFVKWSLANDYADDLSIDRINNDGNYEPSNCRWATKAVQNANKRDRIRARLRMYNRNTPDWEDGGGI